MLFSKSLMFRFPQLMLQKKVIAVMMGRTLLPLSGFVELSYLWQLIHFQIQMKEPTKMLEVSSTQSSDYGIRFPNRLQVSSPVSELRMFLVI